MNAWSAQRREKAAALAILAVLAATVLVLAGVDAHLPELHPVDAYRGMVGAVTGTAILAASLYLMLQGAVHAHPLQIVGGIVFALVALPIVGITVGLPAPLVLFANALNLLIDFVQAFLRFLGVFT